MYGQRSKVSFKKTTLFALIRDSVLTKFKDSDASELTNIIATKLRNAPKIKEIVY